jgi:hypothetical protein
MRKSLAGAAALVLSLLLLPSTVSAQPQVKIFGTNGAGQSVPIQVANDGTMKLTLAISGYEFLGTSFNTTLTIVDPTAARTITLPNATGTVALVGAPIFTGTSTFGAIATQDVVAIVPNTSGTRFTGTLTPADLTADRTWTLPNTAGTLALLAAPTFTTSIAVAGGGDTATSTATAGAFTTVATGSSTDISFVFTPKGAGQTTLTGGITGGCSGTPTAATAGVSTTCTGPEMSPPALFALIQQLQAEVATLRAQIGGAGR